MREKKIQFARALEERYLAYALTTHNLFAAIVGLLSGWFGFHYRILHEDHALEKQFGREYKEYQTKTGTWFPKVF